MGILGAVVLPPSEGECARSAGIFCDTSLRRRRGVLLLAPTIWGGRRSLLQRASVSGTLVVTTLEVVVVFADER